MIIYINKNSKFYVYLQLLSNAPSGNIAPFFVRDMIALVVTGLIPCGGSFSQLNSQW